MIAQVKHLKHFITKINCEQNNVSKLPIITSKFTQVNELSFSLIILTLIHDWLFPQTCFVLALAVASLAAPQHAGYGYAPPATYEVIH